MATRAQMAAYTATVRTAPTLTPAQTPAADPEVTDEIVDQIAYLEAQRRGLLKSIDHGLQAYRWAHSVPTAGGPVLV